MKPSIVGGASIYQGHCLDVLRKLRKKSVHCVATSPPYWGLRSYGDDKVNELGNEKTPEEYIENMVEVFRLVKDVMRDDATLWLNLGDTYSGGGGYYPDAPSNKNKSKQSTNRAGPNGKATSNATRFSGLTSGNLVGIPWRVALALQADGWVLRQDIIWEKPNPMPESVTNRCTKSHEYVFLLTKSMDYFYDNESIKESISKMSKSTYSYSFHNSTQKGETRQKDNKTNRMNVNIQEGFRDTDGNRNKRSVWDIPTYSFPGAHFAVFPPKLVEPMILAGTSLKGCCPHCGAPWQRIVEKDRQATRPANVSKIGNREGKQIGNRDPLRHVTETKTIGWEATCQCRHDTPEPCTVLDPFCGAATTGLVATLFGRKFIGIELYPENVHMGIERIKRRGTPRPKKQQNKIRGFFSPEEKS